MWLNMCRKNVKKYIIFRYRMCFFKLQMYAKGRFRPKLRTRPRWGSLRRSSDPLVGYGGGHPFP